MEILAIANVRTAYSYNGTNKMVAHVKRIVVRDYIVIIAVLYFHCKSYHL